jgi:tRNA U55 pseudouridine synthase TruB
MAALTRTSSGYFKIEDSHTIEEVIAAAEADNSGNELEKLFIPADITLTKLGIIVLNDKRVTAFLNGNSSWPGNFKVLQESDFRNTYRVYAQPADHSEGRAFLGTATLENGSLVPAKVIK